MLGIRVCMFMAVGLLFADIAQAATLNVPGDYATIRAAMGIQC